MPYTMGSLYWQIDDCWPTMSWSSMDYYGRWKASHYRVRDAYKEVMVSPVEDGKMVKVFIVSDRLKGFAGKLEVRLLDFRGKELFAETRTIEMKANTSMDFFQESKEKLLPSGMEHKVVLSVRLMEGDETLSENLLYFGRPKELDLPETEITTTVADGEGGKLNIEVSATALAKGVYIDLPDMEGAYSDNYFDLLPGGNKDGDVYAWTRTENINPYGEYPYP